MGSGPLGWMGHYKYYVFFLYSKTDPSPMCARNTVGGGNTPKEWTAIEPKEGLLAKSWFAPAVFSERYTVFDFCVLDLDPFPVTLVVFCLPRPRLVSPELCLLAACPDSGTRPCLCRTPAVLPCTLYLTLYCLTILIKSCKWIQTLLTHHYS